MNNLGQTAMWLGLISVGLSSIFYWFAHINENNQRANQLARLTFVAFAGFLTVASILLMHFILNHDFSYDYIVRYSSRDLPLEYLVSSFWAGQEGSFLLWVLLGAWLGLFVVYTAGDMEPQVMLPFNLNNIFLMILLIKQSPFRTLPYPPADGQGLNMLLQDPWMVIHPPIVFIGYAAFAIPFSYAIAALWRRDYDSWIRPALPWAVFAFLTLGAGIIIGGYWSYKVLGWGGYWGWDPVENASLLPWLAGMALMHGMILQNSKSILRKTNFIIAAFSFLLVIYCTFLTRSGILADFSVHSFTDLGITGWLVLFMAVFTAISVLLIGVRAKEIPVTKRTTPFSYISREFGMILAIIILCASALVTGVGTSAPLITRMLEKPSKVATEFYVQTNLPIGVIMLFLLAFVPHMSWGKNDLGKLSKKLLWAAVGTIVAAAVTLVNGWPGVGSLLIAILAGATTGMNLHLAIKLLRKKVTLSAGAVTHFGLGLMFLGIIASSVYDKSTKADLSQGKYVSAMGYELKLNEPKYINQTRGEMVQFPISAKKGAGAEEFSAQPDIRSEMGPGGESRRFVRPHIRRGLVSDLYISPVEFNPGDEKAVPNADITLAKNALVRFYDYELSFKSFDLSNMGGQSQGGHMSVGANIEARYKDGAPVQLKPVMIATNTPNPVHPDARVKLPGPIDAYATMIKIDAGSGTIFLDYEGPEPDSAAQDSAGGANLIVDVSTKPGMTILWVGCILIMAGGVISIVRRRPSKPLAEAGQ